MIGRLLESSRTTKRLISLFYDVIAISFSLYLAVCLRLSSFSLAWVGPEELASAAVTIIVSIALFIRLGLYRAILRFMAHQALLTVALGVVVSASTLAASSFFLDASLPRSVPIIFAFAALFFIGLPRVLVRNLVYLLSASEQTKEKVLIYGAGRSGYQLATSLQGSRYKNIGFVDDNPSLHGTLVSGLCVYSPEKLDELIKNHEPKHILLALGAAPRSQRSAIVRRLEHFKISIKTIPEMHDILIGKAKIADIQDVQIEDLLGRDPVQPIPELLSASIKNKSVLVTGAGGSIGSELCRQILRQGPRKLVLFEANEYNLYKIEQELQEQLSTTPFNIELISLIGTVQDRTRLEEIFSLQKINTIYHAAAYKHVPLIEHNVIEAVRNNVLGTWRCAEAAINAGVNSFVLISTDKAVRPTNVMGATKRMAELVLQALTETQATTRFTMVRFGNVLGSSGSVVPLFRKQIKMGGPITVTHPDIIRYFMTIPEAAELVIQAGSMGKGGDVFVLDMGDPVKIFDLASRMINLSGLTSKTKHNPDGDIEIQFTGLRPGEKLYEELLIGGSVSQTSHSRIMRAEESFLPWSEMMNILTTMENAANEYNSDYVKQLLADAPTSYQSETEQTEKTAEKHAAKSKTKLHIVSSG